MWTDEKFFTVQATHNSQSDHISDIPVKSRIMFWCQKHPGVMVWAGMTSDSRKTPFIFIKEGIKFNRVIYKDMLANNVKDWIDSKTCPNSYIFMQDSAPSHTSNLVQEWCQEHLNGFWLKDLWPPSSPDLNPMDFVI